ncbi:MAG: alkaline phosphatase D family protein [Myxococcales bacterium]|nr:alkaline phosphatase D family protein [Myxococcales bacterium]
MKRRDFLKQAGCFVVTASVGKLTGCGDDAASTGMGDAGNTADAGTFGSDISVSFPQGVASGDPRPNSVMLWTRAEPEDGESSVMVELQVALDESFADLVVEQTLEAGLEHDHTLRVVVEALSPSTTYYYRFVSGEGESRVGRTWTAPEADDDVAVGLAWVSCQDFTSGFHGAYRRMINDDEQAAESDRVRFVLHVGDFIYETRREEFQTALDEDLERVDLIDRDGVPRTVAPFPSGGGETASGGSFAQTVDDYRHLYKSYLGDPDLQDARARWPFVCIWDDHEFSNDCWQTQANYTSEHSTDEPSQSRRVAANQAWFEYIPAILEEAEEADGVAPAAHDFRPVEVEDVRYDEGIDIDEPNNSKALGSLTIYRRLRFGRHLELVLTDNRSYRSDHALPEELTTGNPLIFQARGGLPLDVVVTLDAGNTANGGDPPASIDNFENVRRDSPPGTMLGAEQKQWFKDVMRATDATFKLWGNSVPLLRVRLDATAVDLIPKDLMLGPDAWDGYGTERRELMGFLRDEGIQNVISLSGDHHAHLAGVVHDDYDADSPTPVMVDFATAGISSAAMFTAIAGAIRSAAGEGLEALVAPILKVVNYDETQFGGERKAVPNFNALVLYGSAAANAIADSGDVAEGEALRLPGLNDHLRFVDTASQGYGLARIGADGADVTLVAIEVPVLDRGEEGARERYRASFTVPRLGDGESLVLDVPEIEGAKPFPLG